jgi:hypothetical protein
MSDQPERTRCAVHATQQGDEVHCSGTGSSKKDQEAFKNEKEARKVEKALTQEMLVSSTKVYNKAITATYELLCKLLAGKPQTQWDCIILEMHERDSWIGADDKEHDGKHPKSFSAFSDCLKLAKRQQYCIQQGIQKPQQATVHFSMWKY